MDVDLKVAEMMCSRLCHDLIGPVGAVNSGLELMGELDGSPDGDAMRLVTNSGHQASARLQFFRIAFGLAGSGPATSSLADAAALADSVVSTSRVRLDWPDEQKPGVPTPGGNSLKLLLNIILLAAGCLPRGGTVQIACTAGTDALTTRIRAEGERCALSDANRAAFEGRAAVSTLTPRTVQPCFAGLVSRRLNAPVSLEAGHDFVLARVVLPAAPAARPAGQA